MDLNNGEIMDYLREKDIKPSSIRIKVLKYLMDNQIHPTVDDIYKGIGDDIPTLSRTSIYNTVNLFKQNGVVVEINLGEKESRYDINTKPHGHFKCEKCGNIYDFPLPENLNKKLSNFTINRMSINYYGLCPDCRKESE
ncbi:MAG: transcriptional repressor [Tissierellia bacterium]|nr:transcriptional repressor [Tissierellia bacterium]